MCNIRLIEILYFKIYWISKVHLFFSNPLNFSYQMNYFGDIIIIYLEDSDYRYLNLSKYFVTMIKFKKIILSILFYFRQNL